MTLKVATTAVVLAIAILAWHQLRAQPLAGSSSTQTAAAARRTDEPVAIASAALARALPQNVPTPASVDPAANPAVRPHSPTPAAVKKSPQPTWGQPHRLSSRRQPTASNSHHHAAVSRPWRRQQIKCRPQQSFITR